MNTTTAPTITDICDLSLEEFYTFRSTIREAYETCSAATFATRDIEDHEAFFAAHDAADAGFASHLGYIKSRLSSGTYRRYDLTFDGIRIGWVCQTEAGGDWSTWATPYEGATGRKVDTAPTRKQSAFNSVQSLAIYGNLGI